MGKGDSNLIERSYKLLFILYAPITLISYVVKAVGGVSYSYFFITLLLVAAFSLVVALILLLSYIFLRKKIINEPDSSPEVPFIFTNDFMIPFIGLSIFSYFTVALLIYTGNTGKVLAEDIEIVIPKTQIVLMMGVTDDNDFEDKTNVTEVLFDYGMSELMGLGYFMKWNTDDYNEYDFQVINHKMNYNSKIEDKVIEYIEAGAKYFICTTSKVAVPLSERFEDLIAQSNFKGSYPILICTNSSSTNIKTKTNRIYRINPRAQEQAEVLSDKGKSLGLKKATFIAIDDEFGQASVEAFKKEWTKDGGQFVEGIFLDNVSSKRSISEQVQDSDLLSIDPEVIFIAHFDKGLIGIFEGVKDFPEDIVYLATTSLSVKLTQLHIDSILAKKRWYTCVPEVKTRRNLSNFNINSSFIYFVLNKLIYSIDRSGGDMELFHENWVDKADTPILHFDYEKNGDFKVFMKIDSSTISF